MLLTTTIAIKQDCHSHKPKRIKPEHKYQFVGRIGRYIPVKIGCGGGVLLRDKGDLYNKQMAKWEAGEKKTDPPSRYASVTGADNYRWLDAEVLKTYPVDKVMSMADMSYYRALVDAARAAIQEYGNATDFITYGNMDSSVLAEMEYPPDDELPF